MQNKMKQPRQTHDTPETPRSCDDEFKREAVALMETGHPVGRLAREIDVKASMLSEWKRKFESSAGSGAPAPSGLGCLQEENRSLRADVVRLRQRGHFNKRSASSPRLLSRPSTTKPKTRRPLCPKKRSEQTTRCNLTPAVRSRMPAGCAENECLSAEIL
jgi:transposase-like protein